MKEEEKEECFCKKPKSSIRLYMISGFVPDEALQKNCCWNHINSIRMLEHDIPRPSWDHILGRRKALLGRNNSDGYDD